MDINAIEEFPHHCIVTFTVFVKFGICTFNKTFSFQNQWTQRIQIAAKKWEVTSMSQQTGSDIMMLQHTDTFYRKTNSWIHLELARNLMKKNVLWISSLNTSPVSASFSRISLNYSFIFNILLQLSSNWSRLCSQTCWSQGQGASCCCFGGCQLSRGLYSVAKDIFAFTPLKAFGHTWPRQPLNVVWVHTMHSHLCLELCTCDRNHSGWMLIPCVSRVISTKAAVSLC